MTHHADTLTVLERSVLHAYGLGWSREDTGRYFHISPHTVGHLLTSAKEKLQARSLAHAAYVLTASEKEDRVLLAGAS